jgi:N-acyl-D-aspartate/D-glutamate deacylase
VFPYDDRLDGEIPGLARAATPPQLRPFARVLAVYVREKGLLTLEEAIRKMTSLPAARLGLGDRAGTSGTRPTVARP